MNDGSTTIDDYVLDYQFTILETTTPTITADPSINAIGTPDITQPQCNTVS